jgi:hypothetical protein
MPRGFFRQYPAPSDFGFEENQPVPLRVLLGAMIRTWCSRLRAILAPDPATPAEDADDQTEARGA